MNITEKLNSIRETKEAIKTSIKNKGVEVLDTDPFSTYAEKIDSIESGGGDLSEYFGEDILSYGDYVSGWAYSVKKMPPLSFSGTNASGLFYRYYGETLDLTNINTSETTSFISLFDGCTELTELNLTNINTSKATNMSKMIANCRKLTNIIGVENLNTDNVEKLTRMFEKCELLTSLDLSKWNVENATDMSYMFTECNKLIELNLSGWANNKVINIAYMFNLNSKVKVLDLSGFDFSKTNRIETAFNGCSSLENLQFGINLGKGYTQKTNNYSYYRLNLSSCKLLTHDSLMNVINNLYDLNLTYDVANGGILYTQSLSLGADNIAKLSEEELAICTTKGWSVS